MEIPEILGFIIGFLYIDFFAIKYLERKLGLKLKEAGRVLYYRNRSKEKYEKFEKIVLILPLIYLFALLIVAIDTTIKLINS